LIKPLASPDSCSRTPETAAIVVVTKPKPSPVAASSDGPGHLHFWPTAQASRFRSPFHWPNHVERDVAAGELLVSIDRCQSQGDATRYVGCISDAEQVLRSAYRAFNTRDVEAAIELMHPEVDWPNAWEGGRVVGRAAVREYWNRQFAAISSMVEPEGFTEEGDGSTTVDVHQVVHDGSTGELISDSRARHRYRIEDGLVVRMDVLDAQDQQ
jgi:ketosteroid isomerase-like protein